MKHKYPTINRIEEKAKSCNIKKKQMKPRKLKLSVGKGENSLDERIKRKNKPIDTGINFKPQKVKSKKLMNKRIIKNKSKKVKGVNKYSKADIKEYMVKKDREIKKKERKRYNENTNIQLKVIDNLNKLDKKRKKLVTESHSKNKLNLYNLNKTEKYESGLTMSKNASMQKSTSKNNLTSRSKMVKTQKKPKTRRIITKVDSPSKILSSDSEMEDMDPDDYLEY